MEHASQILVCTALGGLSAFITHVLNTTHVHGEERFLAAYEARLPGQGIVTVSNHVTAVDDPGAVMPIIPASWLLQPHRLRWTLCARDRCFTNPFVGAILSAGRVLPVDRGGGAGQPLMDAVVGKLDAGDWVHMFPEGARQPVEGGLGRMRPGVGRLIADARVPPVVLPFYHRGFLSLQKKGEFFPISFGHRLDILVGEPIAVGPLLAELRAAGMNERDVHAGVSARIGVELDALRVRMEGIGGPGAAADGQRQLQPPQPTVAAGGKDSGISGSESMPRAKSLFRLGATVQSDLEATRGT